MTVTFFRHFLRFYSFVNDFKSFAPRLRYDHLFVVYVTARRDFLGSMTITT